MDWKVGIWHRVQPYRYHYKYGDIRRRLHLHRLNNGTFNKPFISTHKIMATGQTNTTILLSIKFGRASNKPRLNRIILCLIKNDPD
jgi:hypothetical protein